MASYSWLPPESHLPRRLFGAMLRRIAALPLHGPPSRSVRKHTKKTLRRRRLGMYLLVSGKLDTKSR
jgi:hypothetical protein